MKVLVIVMAIAQAACATVPGAPSHGEVTQLETLRIIEPLASPTGRPAKFIVEFGPEVEVRNLSCLAEGSAFRCHFQSRTKPFAGEYGEWEARTEIVERVRNQWRFGIDKVR